MLILTLIMNYNAAIIYNIMYIISKSHCAALLLMHKITLLYIAASGQNL